MSPQLPPDTAHLTKYVDTLDSGNESNAGQSEVVNPALEVAKFMQHQRGYLIDLYSGLGCAAFSMGVVTGTYLLLYGL
ncbi:hypothetical protein A6V36_00950 [Paraburkholderia ginsengiterrae]|uniref:Uncharacterized protein n=1 Tax=Paraburkholderia ginsengiterrae TaxID=1462993 RepID=A0A1A9NAK5_9BURK|nr:hypothetical protein [Paraburkholderia ginsengiterrae]OAJ60400.1 hypothetical protein A6V36_00950 [Paraburkholderia ginsengiterrae]OAJ63952.1 hypothetical protein A6V37_00140 [Paraburkholderia ginsengiterrae]